MTPDNPDSEVTQLLNQWRQGDPQALPQLMPLIYNELRRIARRHWSGQQPGHTLQPTALIHEAYLKIAGSPGEKPFERRTQFFALASTAMRQILVNHAEANLAEKRGGDQDRVPLEADLSVERQSRQVCALHDALAALEKLDPRKSRMVEMRYFGGLNTDEIAQLLEISPKTVARDWEFSRAWLLRQLGGDSPL
jgi:RNA polymerase sigma-70 factor, ECF subfamily